MCMCVTQVTQVLDAMHPNRCDYRVDVITAKYQDTKSALSQLGHVTEDTEPWFNFPAAWVQVSCVCVCGMAWHMCLHSVVFSTDLPFPAPQFHRASELLY